MNQFVLYDLLTSIIASTISGYSHLSVLLFINPKFSPSLVNNPLSHHTLGTPTSSADFTEYFAHSTGSATFSLFLAPYSPTITAISLLIKRECSDSNKSSMSRLSASLSIVH